MSERNWKTGEGFTNGLTEQDRQYLARVFTDLEAQIARVRDLHKAKEKPFAINLSYKSVCGECSQNGDGCWIESPCSTIRALEGE